MSVASQLRIAEIYADLAFVAPTVNWELGANPSPEWVGGLLDGEGHFGISKFSRTRRHGNKSAQYLTRVQVGNTESSLCAPLLPFGGRNVGCDTSRWNKNAARCYKWTVHNRQAQKFILTVLPHMRHPVKIQAAKTLLMLEFLRKTKAQRGGNMVDPDRLGIQEHLYQECRKLNARGPLSGNHSAPPFEHDRAKLLADVVIKILAAGEADGLDIIGTLQERLRHANH